MAGPPFAQPPQQYAATPTMTGSHWTSIPQLAQRGRAVAFDSTLSTSSRPLVVFGVFLPWWHPAGATYATASATPLSSALSSCDTLTNCRPSDPAGAYTAARSPGRRPKMARPTGD
jgi:hypothetical protein